MQSITSGGGSPLTGLTVKTEELDQERHGHVMEGDDGTCVAPQKVYIGVPLLTAHDSRTQEGPTMSFGKPPVGGGEDFTPAPQGLHNARLIDVIDRGYWLNDYNKDNIRIQRRVTLRFALGEINEETGEPFTVDDWVTYSMDGRATLRKRVHALVGKTLNDDEAEEVNIEDLIGEGAQLNVVHKERKDSTFANVDSAMQIAKGTDPPPAPEGYERVYHEYLSSKRGSLVPDFDFPANSRPLTEDEAKTLNAMDPSIRDDLDAAIESVVGASEASTSW